MSRLLRLWPIVVFPLGFVAVIASCSDDETTNPTTTSTNNGGNGPTTSTTGGNGAGGSAGSAGMAGSGGNPMPCMGPLTGQDTCPGETVNLTTGTMVTLCGDTSMANNDYADMVNPCAATGSDGPELVYAITLADPGTLKVRVKADPGSNLNPSVYARSPLFGNGCEDAVGSFYGCWNFFETHEEFAFDNPAETFFIFVDGDGASEGRFGLEISLTAPMCGDGVTNDLNGTEQCDDGNTTAGDGCDANCNFEVVTLFDTCDGEPIVLPMGQTLTLTDNTTGYADDYTAMAGMCNAQPGGHDRIYEVTAGASGTLTATIGFDATGTLDICETYGLINPGCWDYVLWAVGPNACVDMGGTQIACSDGETYGVESISFPVVAGEAYHIVVDGFTDAFPGAPTYGPYNLRIEHTP